MELGRMGLAPIVQADSAYQLFSSFSCSNTTNIYNDKFSYVRSLISSYHGYRV
jgi:hypothetical protein